MPGFVVFVDRANSFDPILHSEECFYYKGRRKASTSDYWYGPFDTFSYAWKVCFKEAQNLGKMPQVCECIKERKL